MEIEPDKFDLAIDTFINNIESLRDSFPTLLNRLNIDRRTATAEHDRFLREKGEFKSDIKKYFVNSSNYFKFKPLKSKMLSTAAAVDLISRSFLISLVSQVDSYVRELMKIIIDLKPSIISNTERKLSYLEIIEFDSFEEAKKHFIDKEIDSVIRESITEQFSWFEKKVDVQLRKDLPSWSNLIELTQRRNLFVHNNGRVSSQYLKTCKKVKVDLDEVKLNDILNSDVEYFESSFKCVFEIGLKLNQVLRRKLIPTEKENADKSFISITYDLIEKNNLDLAREMFEFSSKYINKFTSKDLELRVKLNHAQTYKWLGEEKLCKKILDSIDLSATSEFFKMAHYALSDKFDSASKSVKIIGNNSNVMNKEHYFDWPIFKEFIKSDEFKEAYKDVFGEDGNLEI